MFISILLNTEYMSVDSRSKWYLKNLLHCKENGWALITHQYLGDHFSELQDSINDRFFNEFEMRRFSLKEVNDVEQYFLPDWLFDDKEKNSGSRTEMLLDITKNRWLEFEEHLERIINHIQCQHPGESIDGIFHCLEGFESLHYLSKKRGIPLISYVFSAIRRPHGYRQTLYFSNFGRLFCTDECEKRYNVFINECDGVPCLDHRELIALFGKERTLPLIPLINKEPKYEVCICGEGFQILPHIFSRMPLTDDDFHYEYSKRFPKDKIISRQHPIHLNQIGVDRSEIHNDPASTILSCRRLATGCSQIILKAMLWNRTAVMPQNTIPLSFICEKDYSSEKKVPLVFLNYYLFGYLIPSGLLFDDSYWKWRLTNPDERAIYLRHIDFICNDLNVDPDLLYMPCGDKRFRLLLEERDVDQELIDLLLNDRPLLPVDFDTACSRFDIGGRSYWRINEVREGNVFSRIRIKGGSSVFVSFFPLDDVAGVTELVAVRVNGELLPVDHIDIATYMPKITGKYSFSVPSSDSPFTVIECEWRKIPIKVFLDNKTI